jgi:hypothetical protein
MLYPAKKYTTPRTFKKGTIARDTRTNEKFVLNTDVEALQVDKNAEIWSAHDYLIYLEDQRPVAIPVAKKPEKISSDDMQLLKQYEMITDYSIGQRITKNQSKLKELAARKLVRIEKGKYGTMGSAYIEQERLGISEEISRLYRIQELRELIAEQGKPEPWKLTKEEYWRSGAGGKAYEGRGTSDYNHTQAVKKALSEHKPVPSEVQRELIKDALEEVSRKPRLYGEEYVQAKELEKISAERERIKATERAEENELNAELNKLPPQLKRYAETEISGTLHYPETHKDYHDRFMIALGKVRKIVSEHQPKIEKKEELAEPLSDYDRVLKAYLEKRGYELTLQDFIWADKYTLRGTARHIVASEAEKKRRQDYVSKNYNEDVGKKLHRGTVIAALERGIKVPDIVLKDYPDLVKKELLPQPQKDKFTEIQDQMQRDRDKISGEHLQETAWQMTSKDFINESLKLNRYRASYEKNPKLMNDFTNSLIQKWKELVEKHGEIGKLSDKVIENYIKLFGEKALFSVFRGLKAKGIEGWRITTAAGISIPTITAPPPPTVKPPPVLTPAPINTFDQTTQRIRAARTLEELQTIKNEINTLPLFANERVKLLELYNTRYSLLLSEKPFGTQIQLPATKPVFIGGLTPKEQRKKAQQKLSTPPPRRLSEFGIGERAQRYYLQQRR